MRRLAMAALTAAAMTGPALAQQPAGPENVKIEFDAAKLNLVVKAIGNGLVKNEADPLLAYIQAAVNARMAEWQKEHQPAEPEVKGAPMPPVSKPAAPPK